MNGNTCLFEPLQQIVNFADNPEITESCRSLTQPQQEHLFMVMKSEIGSSLKVWAQLLSTLQIGSEVQIKIYEEAD
ncbi:hypothetical protein [Paenibacillus sp. Leaf72]|uniref:hypothetical protein n=1 Tax=Paenibacillus sp. Leaf72 TaxID=1736234 RepID=UPI000701A9FB|nr:hypothetical protein [Paenibacillus sp. Leaf72]KQN96876.1 hypothetical protein ASF12_22670 [Paenibacillus sp. Leaf72]